MVNHAYRLQEIADHLVIHHTKLTKALRNAGKTDISRPDPIFYLWEAQQTHQTEIKRIQPLKAA